MSVYAIKLDTERCISCHACELHCQAKNCLPQGAKLGRLFTVGPALLGGKPRVVSAFLPCFHCEEPWCVPACPTGAMRRRESDGVIFIETSLCVGCQGCIDACPWKVPQRDETTGKVIKCDYCRDLVAESKSPACVAGCTTSALSFSQPNTNVKRARAAFAKQVTANKQARRS